MVIRRNALMPIILYEISVPVFIRGLKNLITLLEKANIQANLSGFPVQLLLQSKIYPDTESLGIHLERSSQIPLEVCSYLTGEELKIHIFQHRDFADYIKSIQSSINMLKKLKPDLFFENKTNLSTVHSREDTNGADSITYVLQQAQPNFYYHLTSIYNSLKFNNVRLNSKDLLGP